MPIAAKKSRKRFFCPGLVRHCPQQRCETNNHDACHRVGHPQAKGALGHRRIGAPVLFEKDWKESGHYRGGKGGVGPVVQTPGENPWLP